MAMSQHQYFVLHVPLLNTLLVFWMIKLVEALGKSATSFRQENAP
jgi:hypothetical protein